MIKLNFHPFIRFYVAFVFYFTIKLIVKKHFHEITVFPKCFEGTRQSLSRFFYVPPSRLPSNASNSVDLPIAKSRGGVTGEVLGPTGLQIERFLLNPAREKPQELSQVSPHFGVTTILAPLLAVQPRKRDASQILTAESSLATPHLGQQLAPPNLEYTAMLGNSKS